MYKQLGRAVGLDKPYSNLIAKRISSLAKHAF